MATDLLTRVLQRTETDVPPEEIQNLIDEALAAIEERYGPAVNPATPVTIDLPGLRRKLDIMRPVDTAHAVSIVEFSTADPADVEYAVDVEDWWPNVGETSRTLASNDWRSWNGGRTLERLATGTNPRVYWGSRVEITYVPIDDGNQRSEVAIKLVRLSLEYEGVIERRVGDVSTTFGTRSASGGASALVYADERERLIASLNPRKGLMLR